MEFQFLQPKITKDFIFSKGINQESIIQYYTGIEITSKKLFLSPFRADKKITCSLYKSKNGKLYIHDFATNEHTDCFQTVMKLYNCNYYQALEIIAEDFGLIKRGLFSKNVSEKPKIVSPLKESETCKIQVQIKDFTKEELNWWKQFGIDYKLLKKYHVYSLQHIFLNGRLSFSSAQNNPIFGYYFGKDKNNNELWKCYFPTRKDYRFIGNLNHKILQGYKQLRDSSDLLIINKSMKDTIACRALGYDSISPNSETTFPTERQIEEFKKRFNHILIIFDNDKPGLHNLWKIRKQYPNLNYFWIPKELGAKDLTDLIKLKGFDNVKELVNQFMSNYKFK